MHRGWHGRFFVHQHTHGHGNRHGDTQTGNRQCAGWPVRAGDQADRAVYQVAKLHNVPIIGQGGILTVNDAIEFMIAGAAAIGVGTALFYDPLVCKKINAGISDYLKSQDLASVRDLVGTLRT